MEVFEGGLGPLAVFVRPGHPPGVGHNLVGGLEGLLLACLLLVFTFSFSVIQRAAWSPSKVLVAPSS